MRCYICDAALSAPRFNSDHDSYEPCEFCLAVIQDTLDGFLDTPSADEDDFGGPDPLLTSFSDIPKDYYDPQYYDT